MSDEYDSIDWNHTGQRFDQIESQFATHPWEIPVQIHHGTPYGVIGLETYAESFRAASRSSDVVVRAVLSSLEGKGGVNSG